jgi:hypothetical protein
MITATGGKKMGTAAFDTLKFTRSLRDKAKMPQEQAEAVSEAFADATSEQLVTKDYLDVKLLELRMEFYKFSLAQTFIIIGAMAALLKFVN